MGLRDNWGESIQTLKYEEDLTNQKVNENKELYDIVQKFRAEYQSFFNGDRVSPHVTQSFQHVMKLIIQRLDTLAITMDIVFNQTNGNNYSVTWTDDGKGLAANIKEEVNSTRIYRKKGTIIAKIKNKEIAEYVIVETDITEVNIQCLNCGSTV